jgi:hypothetical protein
MKSFIGLLNSLRLVTYLDKLENAHILTPLTCSTKTIPSQKNIERCSKKIKQTMVSRPLFNNLVDEAAEKLLWLDAATSSVVIVAV